MKFEIKDKTFNEIEYRISLRKRIAVPYLDYVIMKRGPKEIEGMSRLPIESVIDDHSCFIFGDDGEVLLQQIGGATVEQLEITDHSIRAVTSVYPEYINLKKHIRVSEKQKPVLLKDNILTPSLLAEIYREKFIHLLTLEQIEQNLKYQKLKLSADVMAFWLSQVFIDYFTSFVDRLIQEIKKEKIFYAENLYIQNADNQMWSYDRVFRYSTLSRKSQKKLVIYDDTRRKGFAHVDKLFEEYNGIIFSEKTEKHHLKDSRKAACWAAIRVRFEYPSDSGKEESPGKTAKKGLRLLRQIYHEEEKLYMLPPNRKVQERRKYVKPIVDEFFAYVDKNLKYVPEGVQPYEGLKHAKERETELRAFLEDGIIPLDFDGFIGSPCNIYEIEYIPGTHFTAAAFYNTFTETAFCNGLLPACYMEYLLERLIQLHARGIKEIPDDLMPWSKTLPQHLRIPKQQ